MPRHATTAPAPGSIARRLALVFALAAVAGAVRPGDAGADPGSARRSGDDARSSAGDRDAGAVAYADCAACHGADGLGRDDGTFPRIAGQHASVVVKQIDDIRSGRRGNPIMASHVDALTNPEEIADVAAFVASLSPDPGAAAGADSDSDADAEGSPQIDVGRTRYARDCVRCHGADGAGDPDAAVPIVAGQHYGYLLRQLRAIAGSLRRNAHPEMVEVIFDDRDEELRALAAYLAALPWPRTAAAR